MPVSTQLLKFASGKVVLFIVIFSAAYTSASVKGSIGIIANTIAIVKIAVSSAFAQLFSFIVFKLLSILIISINETLKVFG
jgi:hypothetical protein